MTSLGIGDHTCLLYDQPHEALPFAAHYVKLGLEQNEPALYIVDDHSIDTVIAEMERAGIDVARERARSTLAFLNAREYCQMDPFQPQHMIARLRDMGRQMAAIGIASARLVAEMTWTLSCNVNNEQLVEYESWGNYIFEDFTGSAVCMYNRRRFTPATIEGVLRAHPVVIAHGRVLRNPFFEPPELAFEKCPERRLEWMTEQINNLANGYGA